jgi:hypothetical protein
LQLACRFAGQLTEQPTQAFVLCAAQTSRPTGPAVVTDTPPGLRSTNGPFPTPAPSDGMRNAFWQAANPTHSVSARKYFFMFGSIQVRPSMNLRRSVWHFDCEASQWFGVLPPHVKMSGRLIARHRGFLTSEHCQRGNLLKALLFVRPDEIRHI